MRAEVAAIPLSRDCEAILIPGGDKVTLRAGTQVRITQSLGGSYTLQTEQGYLVRLEDKDADAIGRQVVVPPSAGNPATAEGTDVEKSVWAQLKTIYDPEIPINIVDLGLVYVCRIVPLASGGNQVEIEMTLTAPGCGMGHVLKADAERKIRGLPGVTDVRVEVVMTPPWSPAMMSEAVKRQMGFP